MLVELEFGDHFYGRRKTGEPEEKPSKQADNEQQTQPIWHRARIELRSYRWKASTLTTPPSLLDRIDTTEQHAIL